RPSPAAPIRCTRGASASPRERGRYRRCSAFARMATIRDSLNNFQGRFGMKRIITKISFACVFLMLGSTGLWAQATAQISGAVRDQSGAVLPGVEVTATQTETGIARTAVTNETGSYVFSNLALGPYRLEAALPGFRTYAQRSEER